MTQPFTESEFQNGCPTKVNTWNKKTKQKNTHYNADKGVPKSRRSYLYCLIDNCPYDDKIYWQVRSA